MAKYRFQIRKHVRDDMYKNETVEIELTDSEYKSISGDDSKYSKNSALVSSKLGQRVEVIQFPIKLTTNEKKKEQSAPNNSSLFKPLWALPFKLLYRLFKLLF